MLEAINLTKKYNGATALDSLNLKIEPGEVFCLLGANGAGKTTTINLFLNFIDPTSGAAKIKDIDVTARPLETKRYLAYIPEQVMLYKNLTGYENLEYFSALAGRGEYSRARLLGFFSEVGLQREAADQRVGTYSKGMRSPRTYRMLASLGVPPQSLAGGKALGAAIALGLLLVPAALIGVAAIMLYSGDVGFGAVAGRFAVMALSYLLYYSIFVAASLIVSARVKTSQIALIVLLAGWFLNCFVLPRVVTDLAGKLRPTPSAMRMMADIEHDLELGIDGHGSRGARIEELKARTLKQYGVDSIEKLPVNSAIPGQAERG